MRIKSEVIHSFAAALGVFRARGIHLALLDLSQAALRPASEGFGVGLSAFGPLFWEMGMK